MSLVSTGGLIGCTPSMDLTEIDRNVVRVLNVEHSVSGTGFVIARDYVVTNHHVVANGRELGVLSVQGEGVAIHEATLVWFVADQDLAVLYVPNLRRDGLFLNSANPARAKGQAILAIGFPGLADEVIFQGWENLHSDPPRLERLLGESSVSSGVISRIIEAPWAGGSTILKIIQHDATIHPGSSGGPLLNRCGHVVGINTARAIAVQDLETGTIQMGEGIGFASHISELSRLLAQRNLPYRETMQTCSPLSGGSRVTFPYFIFLLALLTGIFFFLRKKQKRSTARSAERSVMESPAPSVENHGKHDPAMTADNRISLASADDSFVIEWQRGPHHGTQPFPKEWMMKEQGIILGRSNLVADVVFQDASVSRRHCAMRENGLSIEIMDLNSSNGTFIEGTRLTPYVWSMLNQNNAFSMGFVDLQVKAVFPVTFRR